jgi:hypothetical protein
MFSAARLQRIATSLVDCPFVSATDVTFHIVEDEQYENALKNVYA